MSGQLYMLTPVTSPMVTRPASPDSAAGALGIPPSALGRAPDFVPTTPASMQQTAAQPAAHDSSNVQEQTGEYIILAPDAVSCSTDKDREALKQLATAAADVGQHRWSPVSSAVWSPISKARSASSSPAKQQAQPNVSNNSNCSISKRLAVLLPEIEQQQCSWKSGLCCTSCNSTKTDGGSCSGCSHWFCRACITPPAAAATAAGRCGLGGSCSNCRSLCNTCKPIACSFCDDRTDDTSTNHSSSIWASSSSNRMCDACAGTCDACKRPACAACSATFVSCSSCGYASCEECRLQAHITSGATTAGGGEESGCCWCAPLLRTASNVRHVSNQRYQMSQLHPSVMASSMEAVGLRDADLDDFDAYNDDLDSMGENNSDYDHSMTGHNEVMLQASQHEAFQPGMTSPHPSHHVMQLGSRALMGVFDGLVTHPSPTSSYSSNGVLVPGILGNHG